jgi:hypothetical protein
VEFVDAKRRTLPLLKVKSSSKGAAALQYHFVDVHGFSRTCPVKPANIIALDSQDEKMPLDKVIVQVASGNLRVAPEPSSGCHPSLSTIRQRLRESHHLYCTEICKSGLAHFSRSTTFEPSKPTPITRSRWCQSCVPNVCLSL